MSKILNLLSIILLFNVYNTFGQAEGDSLYVFVGEKIKVKRFTPKEMSFEDYFYVNLKSRYKVIQNIFGNYDKDIIEFETYGHYQVSNFSKYKYVLLFVYVEDGVFYNNRFLFSDVYKTKDNRWASGYNPIDYYNKETTIQPEPIDFEKEISYNIAGMTEEDIQYWYPQPYYKIVGKKAIVCLGNYVEDLFELRKNYVLKAREIF